MYGSDHIIAEAEVPRNIMPYELIIKNQYFPLYNRERTKLTVKLLEVLLSLYAKFPVHDDLLAVQCSQSECFEPIRPKQ